MMCTALLSLASCSSDDDNAKDIVNEINMSVSAEPGVMYDLFDSMGEHPIECMRVMTEDEPGRWQNLYFSEIKGFIYERGHEYELRVMRTILANPLQDASDRTYELVRILADKKVEEVAEPVEKEVKSEADIEYEQQCPIEKYAIAKGGEYLVDAEGKAAGIAGDLRRMLDEDFHYRLAMRLYSGSIRQAGTEEKVAVQNKVERPAIKLETVSSAQTVETPTEKPQPADEKPEIEPRPQYSAGVQLTLLDLWGMTEEVSQPKTSKKKKTVKKAVTAKSTPPKPKVTVTPTAPTAKPAMENKEVKAENTAKPADPDDIYATLDWDTNPPINGFYEMMMGLTPERRKELRELARQHNEKQVAEKTEVKAVPETSREQPRQEETQPEAVAAPAVTDTPSEAVGTFLFPDIEAEKPKEEVVDLSPRAYHRTPEMHLREGSLVADRGRHNIGYLKDITPYGATFQPLDLKGYQKEKALLYVSLRDAYERLYRYESLRREANVPWREHLNTCYDEFVMRYGNLNAKQNVKLVMMDAGGRDILSLERMENGKFVKADIFEHPVSFAVESHANVGSPEEALSASLNKYGTVNLDYMREITDSTAEDLLTALQGRIYYNPLVTGYEIKDRFIAGNVIEKAERIEAWMGDNPENERMPEVKQALEALKDAEPQRIAFEDLDFNFGERWIPTGVYAAYMSRLFDTEVKKS